MRRLATLFAGLLLLAFAAAVADAAEVYAILAHTQRIQGDVPAGYPIRLEFPLPAGAEPRITLTLTGGTVIKPISVATARLYGPDGQEITLPQGNFFNTTYSAGNPTLTFHNWTATTSGNHQLVITTNAQVTGHAKGRLMVVRPTKIGYRGDETTAIPIQVALEPRDVTRVVVTRVSGTSPNISGYKLPSASTFFKPGQKTTKKGSTSNALFAVEFGVYEYTIGYQAVPAAGKWKAVLKIVPFKGGTPANLRVQNSPGIPISVLGADRFVVPTFAAGGAGVGVATDGNFTVVVTSEVAGALKAQAYDLDLNVSLLIPNAIPLTSGVDFTAGETLSGHRLMFMSGSYFAAFSTASGNELSILRLRTDLTRVGFAQVVTSSPDPTTDFFMTGNGSKVSVGIFHPPDAHNVTEMDAADFGVRTTYPIGGGAYPQKNGAGAAWRAADSVYELWTPDTLDYHLPSDLHRVLYSATWSPTTADAKLVSDIPDIETMPTAVVVDAGPGRTNATIVHYVVADNPPLTSVAGSGKIHRRLFDATGTEIPGSHVILPRASCNRPVSALVGNFLYLGYETPAGPIVERYQILR